MTPESRHLTIVLCGLHPFCRGGKLRLGGAEVVAQGHRAVFAEKEGQTLHANQPATQDMGGTPPSSGRWPPLLGVNAERLSETLPATEKKKKNKHTPCDDWVIARFFVHGEQQTEFRNVFLKQEKSPLRDGLKWEAGARGGVGGAERGARVSCLNSAGAACLG